MVKLGYFRYHRDKLTTNIHIGDDYISFFVDNAEEVPKEIIGSVFCGDVMVGVFEFDPQDQFATYIPDERLAVKPKELTEQEKAEQEERWYTCDNPEICPLSKDGRCTGRPVTDCPE